MILPTSPPWDYPRACGVYGTAFDDGGYTVNQDKRLKQEAQKAVEEEQKRNDDLQVEKDRLTNELLRSGMSRQEAQSTVDLLAASAMIANPENPAAALNVSYQNGAVGAGFNQARFAVNRVGVQSLHEYSQKIKELLASGTQLSKVEWIDDKTGIKFPGEDVQHADNKHNLTASDWKNIQENISSLSNLHRSKKERGRFHGQMIMGQIISGEEIYYCCLEFTDAGEIIFNTAAKENQAYIDDYMKTHGSERPVSEEMASDSNRAFTLQSIQQALGIVNNYKQMAGELAENAPLDRLEQAKAMYYEEGENSDAIWKATGWKLGAGDNWMQKGGSSTIILQKSQSSFTGSTPSTIQSIQQALGIVNKYKQMAGTNANGAPLDKLVLAKTLKKEGYDGIVAEDSGTAAVFDSGQIKSAVANNGEYSPTDNNIFKQQQAENVSPRQKIRSITAGFHRLLTAARARKFKKNLAKVETIMKTPLALQLAGAADLPLTISHSVLNKSLIDKHAGELSVKTLAKIPKALTDPLMIVRNYDPKKQTYIKDEFIVVVDLMDANGATINLPITLQTRQNDIAIKSIFGRTIKNSMPKIPNDQWYVDRINNNDLLYINKKRTTPLVEAARQQSSIALSVSSSYFDNIPTREELVKAWQQNQNFYQDTTETKGAFNPQQQDGKYIISLFRGADASTVIHETGHFFVERMWQSILDGTASEQVNKDFDTLLEYGGMTRAAWAKAFETGDVNARRQVHERIAESFETYIMEGRAPTHELRGIFRRFRITPARAGRTSIIGCILLIKHGIFFAGIDKVSFGLYTIYKEAVKFFFTLGQLEPYGIEKGCSFFFVCV